MRVELLAVSLSNLQVTVGGVNYRHIPGVLYVTEVRGGEHIKRVTLDLGPGHRLSPVARSRLAVTTHITCRS